MRNSQLQNPDPSRPLIVFPSNSPLESDRASMSREPPLNSLSHPLSEFLTRQPRTITQTQKKKDSIVLLPICTATNPYTLETLIPAHTCLLLRSTAFIRSSTQPTSPASAPHYERVSGTSGVTSRSPPLLGVDRGPSVARVPGPNSKHAPARTQKPSLRRIDPHSSTCW